MISKAFERTARRAYNALADVVDVSNIFQGLHVEFTHTREGELQQYGALGLAWKNRNLNFMPANTSRSDLQLYSGIFDMELFHSITYRLTNDVYMFNDLCHYGYNMDHVIMDHYRSFTNLMKYGGSLDLLQVDKKYLWLNKEEIMQGIRSGKYADEGHPNQYWSDPSFNQPVPSVVVATSHELEHLRHVIAHLH